MSSLGEDALKFLSEATRRKGEIDRLMLDLRAAAHARNWDGVEKLREAIVESTGAFIDAYACAHRRIETEELADGR